MNTPLARTLCNLHVASAVRNLLAGYRETYPEVEQRKPNSESKKYLRRPKLENEEHKAEERKLDLRTGTIQRSLLCASAILPRHHKT